jgi:hypothetical protein
MHTSGGLKSDEANSAAWEAGRGAVAGAAKVWNPNVEERVVLIEISLVGCWCGSSRCCWICYVSYLSRLDYSIQGVSLSK